MAKMIDSQPRKGQTRHDIRARTMLKNDGGVCTFSFGSCAACTKIHRSVCILLRRSLFVWGG